MKLHVLQRMRTAAPSPDARGLALLRLGFRPFYLGAALFAMLAIPLWIGAFLGHVTLNPVVPALLWHAHEMLFGFAVAVIVGFLLTAGKAWTGLATPRGPFLGALAVLWVAARVAALAPSYPVYAVLDLALLPVVAVVLADVLLRARNRRNLPLALILVLLSLANLAFHLAVIGAVEISPMRALYAGLALIVMIECVIAGRVIPAFTANAIPGVVMRANPRLEAATLGITALSLASWVFAAPSRWSSLAFVLAAALHLQRQWRWQPWLTGRRPILWILHAAYAWIPIGFVLLALSQAGRIVESAGVHALAVGATGALIIGMITRTARGHTGRPLQASKPEVLAYGLVLVAAVARVLASLVPPQFFAHALTCAAIAWGAAFAIYLVIYSPWLVATRADGKDG